MQDEKARNLDFESASAQTSQISLHETAQSDPESRPKIKSRSRFSSAIRKLSGSTRKKENSPQELAHETAAISSGGEDPEFAATTSAESKLKKKSRLSKRFLLSSLSKKSKISPKTSLDADDDNEERNAALDAFLEAEQGKQAENEKDNIVKEAKSKVAPISTSTSGKQTKVQITISGKKIDERLKTELKTGRTAAECLTTSEKTKQQSKQVSETFLESEAVKKAKKKLKAKKTLAISPTPTTTTLAASVSSTNADKPKDTTEKLVVTHSTSDTPPSERAPLKPFRSTSAGTAVSQTATGNETPTLTRKATTRAAVTLTTPSLTQRLIGSTTPKAKTQRANTLTTGETESKSDPINSATQRGQRLYRSTTLTSTPSTIHTTAPTVTSTAAGGTTAQAIKQRQLQFQLKSKSQSKNSASQSLTRKSENPNLPPLSSFSTTPAQETTTTGNSSGQDDIVSLAESAAYQADHETRPISQDLSDEAAEAALRIAARSIRKLGAIGSHESNFSSSSESQISHQHIIQYVSEPIMNDDFEIRNKSNDDFSLQTEATENTYETQMTAFGDLTMDAKMEPAIITTANAVTREHLYKILVIGEAGTGKTSFIKRYVHQFFSQNYRATIGVDFALKVLNWDDNTIVRLQLWDIAGQERFGNMTRVYYKEAVGAFIVFDVTRSNTFDCVLKWKQDLDSKVQLPDGSPIPCILLANKCDQEKQGIAAQSEKIDEYVKQNGFDDWFETSAKENINIEEAAKALISKILLNDKLITASDLSDGEVLNLMKAEQENLEAKSKCSC